MSEATATAPNGASAPTAPNTWATGLVTLNTALAVGWIAVAVGIFLQYQRFVSNQGSIARLASWIFKKKTTEANDVVTAALIFIIIMGVLLIFGTVTRRRTVALVTNGLLLALLVLLAYGLVGQKWFTATPVVLIAIGLQTWATVWTYRQPVT